LWYDDRDIPFLREDQKDAAEIQGLRSRSIDTFVRAGFDPDSAVKAVAAGDDTLLVHSGGIPTTLYPEGKDPSALGASATARKPGDAAND